MTSSTEQSPNVRQAVPFFMVANMERSLQFYSTGLGFEVKIKWEPGSSIEWCWLQLGNASLMLQAYKKNIPSEKPGIGVSIAFLCNDALQIYQDIVSNGLSPDEPFVGNNMWVVSMKDPDGYDIFFESPADVPEETMYSQWIKMKAQQ